MARKSSVLFIKKWGNRIIIVAIILEMFFWPSLENLAGCGMTWICWSLFRKIGLNETIIKEHIFVWLADAWALRVEAAFGPALWTEAAFPHWLDAWAKRKGLF